MVAPWPPIRQLADQQRPNPKHSRIYEGLFGGVTLDLMHQQSLPVLMSH
jgi:hypothetical protein